MLWRAEWLLSPGRAPLRDGWLRTQNGRISAVGDGPPPPLEPGEEIRTFEGRAILPGLVNAHCHLELTGLEGKLKAGNAFPDWVRTLQGATSEFKPEDYRKAAEDGIRRLLEGGATTVVDVGNSGQAAVALSAGAIRSFACVEVLGLDPAQADERFERFRALAESVKPSERFRPGLAPHAPYSNSPELMRRAQAYQKEHGLPVTLHVAESREEAELFATATGPLQEFCRGIFPGAPRHNSLSPVRWLESEGLLPDGALVVHCNYLSDADIEILARRQVTVVHCPSSHAYFGHKAFPFLKLRAAGVPVCLGTDSLASGNSLSMLEQMRLFTEKHPELMMEEVLAMCTTVPAEALGLGQEIGRLQEGYAADFVAMSLGDEPGAEPTPANLVVAGEEIF
jgi:cytosine/adenosine deaminase-related metal-dependent hydrolase